MPERLLMVVPVVMVQLALGVAHPVSLVVPVVLAVRVVRLRPVVRVA